MQIDEMTNKIEFAGELSRILGKHIIHNQTLRETTIDCPDQFMLDLHKLFDRMLIVLAEHETSIDYYLKGRDGWFEVAKKQEGHQVEIGKKVEGVAAKIRQYEDDVRSFVVRTKREKLALLEELLAFMERHQFRMAKLLAGDESGNAHWQCVSCYKVDDNASPTFEHAPDCRDTARRNELRAQIAELKKELGC